MSKIYIKRFLKALINFPLYFQGHKKSYKMNRAINTLKHLYISTWIADPAGDYPYPYLNLNTTGFKMFKPPNPTPRLFLNPVPQP